MKMKYATAYNVLLVFMVFLLFLLGNRLGMLLVFQQEVTGGPMGFLKASADLLSSYQSDYLGFQVSFEAIPLFMGLLFIFLAFIAYMWGFKWRRNYREGEEHGSARYGTKSEYEPLKDKEDPFNNILLSKEIWLNLDTRVTFLNDNVLVIGGSGSGKTRFYVKPNVLQMKTNYVITDPKGTLITDVGKALKERGNYYIKVLNLVNMAKSMHYNPLVYIYNANDVFKFVNNLIQNTSDEDRKGGDQFWEKSENALLTSLVFLVLATAEEENKNMTSIMELIDLAEASEDDENSKSVLDYIFEELEEELQPRLESDDRVVVRACKNSYEYLACRIYALFKKGAGKTLKSILISVGMRMAIFNLPELEELLSNDELDLQEIGRNRVIPGKEHLPDNDPNKYQKTALFVIISDSDSTFSFIAAILYQQLFDLLYRIADSNKNGSLPVHVRFILDEFANTGKIKDFVVKIATMRSRNISVNILLQNLGQLKDLYKESWETIVGNCDTTLFLGGKEYSTLEYMSKWIGNTTIDYLSINENRGTNGSYSRSNQLISRPLLAPDEIGRLKREKCLIHIRGEHIFMDDKYPLEKHPNIEYTTDANDKKEAQENIYYFDEELLLERKKKKENVFLLEHHGALNSKGKEVVIDVTSTDLIN